MAVMVIVFLLFVGGILLITTGMGLVNTHRITYRRHLPPGANHPIVASNSDMYFNSLYRVVKDLCAFVARMDRSDSVREAFENVNGVDQADNVDTFAYSNRKLALLFFDDLVKCYRRMGYAMDFSGREGLALMMPTSQILNTGVDLERWGDAAFRNQAWGSMSKAITSLHDGLQSVNFQDELLLVKILDSEKSTSEKARRYAVLMYRWASIMAKADGVVTDDERTWLETIMRAVRGLPAGGNIKVSGEASTVPRDISAIEDGAKLSSLRRIEQPEDDDPMKRLHGLIGLAPVKGQITRLANFVKIQRKRERMGMRTAPLSLHCVFTGNPGTGKTTVARIVAQILRNLGVLSKGHLVETDRSGLVAEFVGQTAVKTNKIVDKALDGVLFIDEAYALVEGGREDYGREAIATLLKRMEDDRDRLVVILAGYTDEMKRFMESNPGLRSRFNRYVDFPDYSAEELSRIFLLNVESNEYVCTPEALSVLMRGLEDAVSRKDRHFGNGRHVRNLFERVIEQQAMRLAGVSPLTEALLREITGIDVTRALGDVRNVGKEI